MPNESGTATLTTANVNVSSIPHYAEVAVPLHVSKTFLYRLPETSSQVEVGQRILVPLGRNLVTGYIVALHSEFSLEWGLLESDIRNAESVIDSVPVCTREIIEITRWVAEYYASPWGEVIKAALPPGISPAINEFLSITPTGSEELERVSENPTLQQTILAELVRTPQANRESFAHLANPNQLAKAFREMEQAGLVERTQSQSTSFVKTKLVRFVSLAENQPEPEEKQKTTEAQLRVLAHLKAWGAMPLSRILKEAEVGTSTLTTLEKRGQVVISNEAVRRDPFYEPVSQSAKKYILTQAQGTVLERIKSAIEKGAYAAFLLHGVTGSGKN